MQSKMFVLQYAVFLSSMGCTAVNTWCKFFSWLAGVSSWLAGVSSWLARVSPGWLESLSGWLEFFLAGFSLLFPNSHLCSFECSSLCPLFLSRAAGSYFSFEWPLRDLKGLIRLLEKSLVRPVGKELYKVCNCAALET